MADNDEITGLEIDDVGVLKQALAGEKEKAEKYLANWQRSQADFENYKKRVEQERQVMVDFANGTLILNLLPVVDDLERALASVQEDSTGSSWVEGIKRIYDKLRGVLKVQGITEIRAKGEAFDPNLHEAIMCCEGEEGIVIEESQKGYKFKGKVIRPCMVVVGESRDHEENTDKEK